MSKRKESGDNSEKLVIDKTKCPNCGKNLKPLPTNNPLVDVRCEVCRFRAQVKTHKKPRKAEISVQGGGWDILHKTLKAGYAIPPLIIVFRFKGDYQIRFYPFILRENLGHPHPLTTGKQKGYKQFSYEKLNKLPYFVWHNNRYVKGSTKGAF